MEETISVRIPQKYLREIEHILTYIDGTKSAVIREIIYRGIKQKMLEIALDKFQKNEATASKAAEIAGIPLTLFLDILYQKNINFHYNIEDLREDVKDLL